MSSGLPSSGYHVAWHSVLRGYDATLKSMTSLTRFAWPFDQFKRHVYDPRAASATSALASLFWYACVTAFAAVAITNFINRPEVDTFSVMPAKYELRADDLFYVGKNDDRRASLRIGLKQYAEVIETSRPGDYLTVFGAIGGFGSLLLSVLGILLAVMAAVETVYDDIKTGTFRFREVAAELVGEGAELRDDEKADLPEEKAAPRANSSSPRADDKYLPDAA